MKINYLAGILFLIGIASFTTSCRQSTSTDDQAAIAQKLIGVEFGSKAIDTLAPYLDRNLAGFDSMRQVSLDESVMPALQFNVFPQGFILPKGESSFALEIAPAEDLPTDPDSIAFLHIRELARLIRAGKITSRELTELYIGRLKKFDPVLHCVITLLEDHALAQADRADEELAAGKDRGLLHGIPYGIKDLFSLPGYPTTWGAEPYRDQVLEEKATVIQKLEDAGAVLVAKLVSGALARGDVWFNGRTRNPWDTLQGASGSSAGSGSATAAGLVGFSIGTETLGSITSPSNRNGVTGLRPTYGRVSRYGCMSLSWSMDKVGPICRSATDCAIVLNAIYGADRHDPSLIEAPFVYPPSAEPQQMRVGLLRKELSEDTTAAGQNMERALAVLEQEGIIPVPVRLPETIAREAYDVILRAEAGAFFDELVLSGEVDKMVQQGKRSRANSLRQARFIPAVEYIQANRHRALLIQRMHELMVNFEVIITLSGGKQLLYTNLTGHPCVTLPTGFDEKGHPTSMTLIGNLFDEASILAFAEMYQALTIFDEQIPPGFIKKVL